MKKANLEIYKGMAQIEQKISIAEWEKIFFLSNNATVFNHPHFVFNWFKTFSHLRGNLPILIKGDISDRTIILPMELYKLPYGYKVLFGMGGPYNLDFQDPLISGENMSPDEMRILWEELFRFIRREIPECDQVIIPRLRSSMGADLDNCEQSTVSPYIDLNDCEKLDDVLSKCRASHRGDVKRQIKRLGEIGAVTMRIFRRDEKEDAQEELSRFFKAYESQWKPKGTHTYEPREAQNLFRYLINDMLETGLIHFSVLKCGDNSIHWHYGFLHNNRLYYYKPTYDVSWSNYSPGKVHVAYLIEECIRNKIRYFDFLYGGEPYKYNWAPIDEKLYCLKKWNGLRPMQRFVEEFIKPTYQYVKRLI
jgi:CelD/BcsL family acetyltransferase involved in cellulose biosynthesis